MSSSQPPSSSPAKRKWGKHKDTPEKQARAQRPQNTTTVSLDFTMNPTTKELTTNVRLGLRLRQGIADPRGFMEEAWESGCLRERIVYARRAYPAHPCIASALLTLVHSSLCAGTIKASTT